MRREVSSIHCRVLSIGLESTGAFNPGGLLTAYSAAKVPPNCGR